MERRTFLKLGLGTVLLALTGADFALWDRRAAGYRPEDGTFPWPRSGPVVILAPHPDDEALGAGGLIQDALHRGHDVRVVLITAGDGFRADTVRLYRTSHPTPADYLAVGRRRYEESAAALEYLGVPRENLRLLGFPDAHTGILWKRPWDKVLTDRYTKVRAVPYAWAWRPGTPYSGNAEIDLLKAVLSAERPGLLIVPHPNDVHPDHWATGAFTTIALAELAAEGEDWARDLPRLTYLVHWGGWPPPWPRPLGFHPEDPLVLPRGVENDETIWRSRPVAPKAVHRKEEAILRYQTQMIILGPLLESFARPTEPFGYYLPGRPGRWTGRLGDLPVVLHGQPAPHRLGAYPRLISLGIGDSELYFGVRWEGAPGRGDRLRLTFSMWGPREQRHVMVGPVRARTPLGEIPVTARGDLWHFAIPREVLGGRREFVLGAEGFSQRQFAGQTAHRLFSV